MNERNVKPFWVDDLQRKHEGYFYGEDNAQVLTLVHEGRSLRLLMPEYVPPTSIKLMASAGRLLFLLGIQLDEVGRDGNVIRGGQGVTMVAQKHPTDEDTYCLFVWHELFEESLPRGGIEV